MTTSERLTDWKSNGVISEEQHTGLLALVERRKFSLFVELSALLYLGRALDCRRAGVDVSRLCH